MKRTLILVITAAMLALTACGAESAATATVAPVSQTEVAAAASSAEPAAASGATVSIDTSYENAASVAVQLLVGTFKLKDTDLALTAEQAFIVLPLWTNYQTLLASMTPQMGQGDPSQGGGMSTPDPNAAPSDPGGGQSQTQTQLNEILAQLQAAMTADQVNAIVAMQLTSNSTSVLFEELGITAATPEGGANGSQPQGGPGGGGTPPDNSGSAPADAPSGSADAGGAPQGNGRGGGDRIDSDLLQALIDYLASIQ